MIPENWSYESCVKDPCPLGFNPNICANSGLFWPIIVIALVIFLVWTEYESQYCRVIETDEGPVQFCSDKVQPILPTDTPEMIIDKIIYSLRKNHTVISWRRALLASIISMVLILMYYYRTALPNGFIFFMLVLVLMFIIYFPLTWFGAHWFRMNDDKIERSLRELRDKISSERQRREI